MSWRYLRTQMRASGLAKGTLRVLAIALAAGLPGFGISAHASDRHHALIVGVGQYSVASGASPLRGISKDIETAQRMAQALGVSARQITLLRDSEATKTNILAALDQLRQKVRPGDKVFIYFSGHGTSFSTSQGCEQGLLPYTTGSYTQNDVIREDELAQYTAPISARADKAIVLIDACFSGGLVRSTYRSLNDLGDLQPKFLSRSQDSCSVAVNQPQTRRFAPAMQRLGVPEQNFVQISAARDNEVSWDSERLGGLATHSLAQCLLGDVKDLNSSGAITMDEVRHCAQTRLNSLMAPHQSSGLLPSTIQVRGSRNLIVLAEPAKPATPAPTASPLSGSSSVPLPPAGQVQPPREDARIELPQPPGHQPATAALSTLEEIFAQRNGYLTLDVEAPTQLAIAKDPFRFTVRSNTDGYLYAVMLGSDRKSFYLLFPNKIDHQNQIKAGTRYSFPRPGWEVRASGPEGTNHILLVVSQSPRDPSLFTSNESAGGGPFTFALADLAARQRLVDFFVGKGAQGRNAQMAAALIRVDEVR